MKAITDLFKLHSAKSQGRENYEDGPVPFVTSSTLNNGIVAYVTPFADDKVFVLPCISVSGLGFATVQLEPFLPKGNGGDAATVLIPIAPMSALELIHYASAFNLLHSYRFNFARKCTKQRLLSLKLPPLDPACAFSNEDAKSYTSLLKKHITKKIVNLLSTKPITQKKPSKKRRDA